MKIKLPTNVEFDKIKHLIVGLITFVPIWAWFSIEYALVIVISVALLKELNDVFWVVRFLRTSTKRKFSFMDLIFTVAIPLIIYTINEMTVYLK